MSREASLGRRLIVAAIVLVAIAAFMIGLAQNSHGRERLAANGDVSSFRSTLSMLSATSGCKQPKGRVAGGNAVVSDVIVGNLSWKFCYSGGRFISIGTPQKWHDQSWGWAFKKYEVVKGSGVNANGVPYKYRRVYYFFERFPNPLPAQTARPWISMTIRANGTCSMDKFESGAQVACPT
jgi:hypothetical protein